MFIFTAKAPRKRTLLLAALGVLGLIALVLLLNRSPRDDGAVRAETNAARVAYLESLGWAVDPEPVETLDITLPDPLREPYLSYNEIQLAQGFDLTPLAGKTITRCTYAVTNYPDRPEGVQADLYVCDGVLVAGDVVCTGEGGFLAPLAFPGEAKKETGQ